MPPSFIRFNSLFKFRFGDRGTEPPPSHHDPRVVWGLFEFAVQVFHLRKSGDNERKKNKYAGVLSHQTKIDQTLFVAESFNGI